MKAKKFVDYSFPASVFDLYIIYIWHFSVCTSFYSTMTFFFFKERMEIFIMIRVLGQAPVLSLFLVC